ncbi:MAG: anaerobic sulfatase maturase [Kiritimatiellae bacterium]|nr:anaerobic sulfatase maturase [Kiritimatiellia bacterium]
MNFSLLIKPASADCNLRCEYCFYLDHCNMYPETKVHRMSDQVLERMIESYYATPQPLYSFVWQGGEPLLMGESFYQSVTDMQMAYGRPGVDVCNSIQTNATLITDRYARMFKACNFLTGVSLDGPAELHDKARLDAGGKGSHAQVINGIDTLRRNQAEFNILTLVSKYNIKHPVEIYDYLVNDIDAKFLQFIECVELDEKGNLPPYCISAGEWGEFLCTIFDRWYKSDTRDISVRLFDTVIAKMVTGQDICCTSGRDCRQYFVVEYNGDVYPCDFHVLPELKLGNIMTHSWEEMAESQIYKDFGARKSNVHDDCKVCPYFKFCAGDCPKNRVGHISGDASQLSYICEGLKMFYQHTLPKFEELAKIVIKERENTRRSSKMREF